MDNLYNILIIESITSEQSKILQKFKDHQLRHSIRFSNSAKNALIDLQYYNESINILPQLILLSYSSENLELIKKINADQRYSTIKIYLFSDGENFHKNNILGYKINGIVSKALDFKNYNDETYLDTIDLHLHLLRLQLDKNSRAIHLLNAKG